MAEKFDGFIRNNERLLADVSHDLQSPVGRQRLAINMFESWLSKSQSDDPRAGYLLGVIKKENRLISTMLNDLMTYTEIKNMNHLRKSNFDLAALLRSVVADMEFTMTSNDKTICLDIVSEGQFYGDQSLIYRSIDNVLGNASRFAKSRVNVELEYIKRAQSTYAQVTIIDDGPGIDNENTNAICEPFYRLDNARNHENKHLGIGLSITQQIVDLHNGKLFIQNREHIHTGLKVTMFFPVEANS
jgi:two-component system sensor histidine kinase CpxA